MKKEIRIGIFALLTLFLLYWGISFLKGRDLFGQNRTYYAYYENVSGIQVTSPIIIRGISVGSVTKINFKPEMNNMVELQLSVKSGYKIPDNTVARMASTGIIGGKAIELELGDSQSCLADGSVIKSETEMSIFDMAGSELDYFKQKLGELMRGLDQTIQGVNAVLGEDGGSIRGTMENVEAITATIRDRSDSIALVIDNLTAVSTTLAGSMGGVESVIENIDEFSGTLVDADIAGLVAKLNQTVDSVNGIINSTDGTVGMLLNDAELYGSLTEVSNNLAILLADLEANPKKYVHFSLFGGKKNK